MGKTPEKQSYGSAMGLRYRRKVPAAAPNTENTNSLNHAAVDPAAMPTTAPATSGKQQRRQHQKERGDNQLEHQPPRADAEPNDGGLQPDAPPTYARKKKHKQHPSNNNNQQQEPSAKKPQEKRRKELSPERAAEDRPASPVPSAEQVAPIVTPTTTTTTAASAATTTTVSTPTAPTVSPKPKRQSKKKVKRNDTEPSAPVLNDAMAEEEPVKQQAVVVVEKQQKDGAEIRRRKPFGTNKSRKDSPSLMKQLLWKVKAPVAAAPTTPPVPEQPPVSAASVEESVRVQVREEEDEEVAFAAEERHSLKRMSTSLAKSMSSFPVESSSQETQSGSEDESSFVHYNLLSGDDSAHEPSPAFRVDLLESCFPTPLAIEAIESAKLRNPKTQVHEILLDNFAFSPAELSIVKGDLVVWRVSEQTLGMVEHSLDATLFDASGSFVRKTSTPLLRPGSAFAWRLDAAGRLEVECSVYKSQCAVQISEDVAAKRRYSLARANALVALADPPRRAKKPSARAKRVAKLAREALAAAAVESVAEESEGGSSEPVEVFHRSKDLARVPELDAGVCREVLSQLEDVKAAVVAAFIVVGDIACPVAEEGEGDDGADVVESDENGAANNEVEDFQQRIIAMLQRSEESQARQRDGFVVASSGFNAGSAYKFFKRRFARMQNAEEAVVYARCPERDAPRKGLALSDVLRALVG